MTISDGDHELISNIAKSIAIDITEMMGLAALWGAVVQSEIPEHFCALEHPEEAEELIIRMFTKCISIKVSIQDKDYGKDREGNNSEYSEELIELNNKFLDIIRGIKDNEE